MAWQRARWSVVLALGLLLSSAIGNAASHAESLVVPGSTLLESAQLETADQLIPLGSVKEGRDGRASPERSERVGGRLQKALYQLPSELSIKESRELLQASVKVEAGHDRLLYQCDGRECGQTNLWATDVFGESLLLGNDRTQFALIYVSDDLHTITMLYGSERPNRRSYYIVQTIALASAWTLVQPAAKQVEVQRWAVNVPRTAKGKKEHKRAAYALNPATSELPKRQTQHWAVVAHECSPQLPAPQAFAQSQQLLDEVMPLLQSIAGKVFHPINMGNTYASPCASGKNLEIIELRP